MKPIHPLRRWLFDRQMTYDDMAAKVGCSAGYLSEIMQGKKRPSLDFIDRLTAATDGAITALDFQATAGTAARQPNEEANPA